jgi:hypothetical protein
MKVGEKRYFRWGDEKPGTVTVWTIREDRSVHIIGTRKIEEVLSKGYIMDCPYN